MADPISEKVKNYSFRQLRHALYDCANEIACEISMHPKGAARNDVDEIFVDPQVQAKMQEFFDEIVLATRNHYKNK